MGEDIKWAIGLAITLGGFLIAGFRALAARISASSAESHKRVDVVSAEIHKRIDDVKDRYVRRDDLDGHLGRVDANLKELKDEVRTNHAQVIALLTEGKK